MTSPWRHHLRRARFAVTTLVAVLLIALAVAMGVVQLLLPVVTHYPDFIARQLSERLHRPVKFASVGSTWQPSGPLLAVRDLTLGPGHPGGTSITFPHAALKFDFGAWLHPAHRWITLRLNDMRLRVEHTASGWQVAGFSSATGQSHSSLQSLPVDLDLRDLHVEIVDEVAHHSWQLFAPRLRVVNVGNAVRFGGSVRQFGTRQGAMINGRMDAAARDYSLHLSTSDLDLAEASRGVDLHGYAVHGGHADIELWSTWRDGELASALARYDLRGLSASGPAGRELALPSLSGVLRAGRVGGGWDLAWRGPGKPGTDIDQDGGMTMQLRGHPGAWRLSAAARAIDVSPWLSLLAMAPQAPRSLVDWVRNAQPHAEIDHAAVVWNQDGRYSATLRFSNLRAAASGAIPGLGLAQGTLRADNRALSLELPPQSATLAVTNVFREPFSFARFGGTVVAWRESDHHWNVAANGLRFIDADGLAGAAEAHLVWPGNGHAPLLSAYAVLDHAKVPDAKRFLPYHRMPRTLVAWMDHALVAGEVTSGRVLMRGKLDDWPFLDHQGRFEATATVRNATFDFSNAWPRATGVDAAVDFVDNHMGVVATHVEVQGITATHAAATIPDLGHGVLELDVQGGGSGSQLLDFVRHTPVGANAVNALEGVTIGGTAKFGIQLSLPLNDAKNFALDGKVDLAHADVTANKWKVALKNLGGPMLIDNRGFRAQDLTGTFRGAPATLSLAVGDAVADSSDIVEAALDTRASAQTLVQGYPDLAPLVAHASGAAPFHIGVRVVAGTDSAPAAPILNVQSSLVGVALDFPAPLDKPAAASLPLNLTLKLPPDGAPLTVSLGDILQVRGRLADPSRNLPAALAMNFGSALPAKLPAEGLVVNGHAKRLDVSGWIQQALGGGSAAAFPQLAHANVSADEAEVFGTDLGALQFDYQAGAADDTIRFDGAAVKGVVQLPNRNLMARGITANFGYLHWPAPPAPKAAKPAPLHTPPPVTSPIAPAAIPPLHVVLGDLRLGDMRLGATRFESAPTSKGMHVAKFDSKGADFSIHASGDWDGTMAYSRSHFVLDIASHDFGKTLAAFGFNGMLAGGKNSHVHIDGAWPGAPSSFSMDWMTGTLGIKMGQGRILAVKPGLGRVLGLLSVRELPSRLMLHFGDVFKSGFGFDHVSATFTLKDGSAHTDDLLIDAPAARITMRGRAGFRARDFDLVVSVTPHLGGTLPVVGAVIGGPVGAAAGLVVQGLVGKGINHAAGSVYRVTGSWDNPKIATVKQAAPVPSASVAPAASPGFPTSAAIPRPPSTAPAPAAATISTPTSAVVPATSSALHDRP